ncbi:phage repressor protein [Enterobacter bugandensis]|uniref:phage repressor protein CI n=1 Tax=Enterobacter bugandensis TaxID=881260 RepID=UPI0006438D96|nr:phage repressor protein CI [Enterobacter bugandensis]KLQ33111.1 phage repressor protein [Enterobacter bugandensis]
MIQNWNGQQKDFTNRKSLELPVGGKDPIERICIAYGFTSRQALCRHLNISQSTMANRVSRGNFPADWVLICAMETGASLKWLVYGHGEAPAQPEIKEKPAMEIKQPLSTQIDYLNIQNGIVKSQKQVFIASDMIPADASSPQLIATEGLFWIVDEFAGELVDGFWLIEMDGVAMIRELYRLPGGRIKVENGKHSFECMAQDVKVIGKALTRTEQI